jgi:hypothetical protein
LHLALLQTNPACSLLSGLLKSTATAIGPETETKGSKEKYRKRGGGNFKSKVCTVADMTPSDQWGPVTSEQ